MHKVELLARDLHESGRLAVLGNKVHKKAPPGETIIFREWDEISEDAREGRRIQARWLLRHYKMDRQIRRILPSPPPPK